MAKRIVLSIKDIQEITGKSYPSAQREFSKAKKDLNLKKGQYLTISAYCNLKNLSKDEVILALNTKN